MISSQIKKVLSDLQNKNFNILIENRDSSESYTWDGKSIALFQKGNRVTDHSIIHEIGHYLACSDPGQREFPEFGLMLGIVNNEAFGPYGGEFRDRNGILKDSIYHYCDGLISEKEQNIQEFVAQKFAIFLGKQYSVSPKMEDNYPGWNGTWEHYEEIKLKEWSSNPDIIIEGNRRFQDLISLLQ